MGVCTNKIWKIPLLCFVISTGYGACFSTVVTGQEFLVQLLTLDYVYSPTAIHYINILCIVTILLSTGLKTLSLSFSAQTDQQYYLSSFFFLLAMPGSSKNIFLLESIGKITCHLAVQLIGKIISHLLARPGPVKTYNGG